MILRSRLHDHFNSSSKWVQFVLPVFLFVLLDLVHLLAFRVLNVWPGVGIKMKTMYASIMCSVCIMCSVFIIINFMIPIIINMQF